MAKTDIIAGRYAKAIFAVAERRGRIDEIGDEIEIAAGVLAGSAAALSFWANPLVPRAKREALVELAAAKLGERIGEECVRFLQVLCRNGRMAVLPGILAVYRRMSESRSGRVAVEVRAAMPLGEDEKKRLAETFGKRTAAQVSLNVEEDPSLLAGLVVKVGDVVYDGSARGRLRRLLLRLGAW